METTLLYEQIRRGGVYAPSPRTARAHNLPAHPTPLIGPASELEQGIDLLGSPGTIAWKQGNHERATELFEESLALFRELDARHSAVWWLTNLAVVALEQNDYKQAVALACEGIFRS